MTGSLGAPMTDPSGFNEDRWRRVGANDAQIQTLKYEFTLLTREARMDETQRIAGLSDGDLAAELSAPAPEAIPPSILPPPAEEPPAPVVETADDGAAE